jgi:putative sterol carrier protein
MIAAKDAVNASEEYKKVAKDWEGNFRCVVQGDESFLSAIRDPKTLDGTLSMALELNREEREKYRGTDFIEILAKVMGLEDPLSTLNEFEEKGKDLGKYKGKGAERLLEIIFSADQATRERYKNTEFVKILSEVTGIKDPVSEIKTMEEALKKVDLDKVLAAFANRASKMITLDEVKKAAIYMLAGFYHGAMTDLKVIGPEDEMGSRFELSGPFGNWKKMVYGEQDATKLVMSGALKLKGDMNYLMKNIRSVVQFTKDFAKPLAGK